MNVAQFKRLVAALPDSEDRAPVVETADGNLLGVRDVRNEDGTAVIATTAVIVRRDGPRRHPGSAS